MVQEVILVDSENRQIGTMEKLKAHRLGLLHRAFSIFVFNAKGETLLQKRAQTKYHSSGLWSNTCCSHPIPNTAQLETVNDRLKVEMGFDCVLDLLFKFEYRTDFLNGLIEHELDYVYVGKSDETPIPNPDEVSEYKWISWRDLINSIDRNPEEYTYWLYEIMKRDEIHDYVLVFL